MLVFHLLAVGAYLGCVMVEIVVESTHGSDLSVRGKIADMHYRTDLFVEIPLLLLIVSSGLALFDPARFHGWYAAKVVLGAIVVLSNFYCFVPVRRRFIAARAGHLKEVERQTRQMVPIGMVLLPALFGVLTIGLTGLVAGL